MLRSYDSQIGRFLQHDPYDEFSSGYLGMGNDPGNLIDPIGGCVSCLATVETVVKAFSTLTPVTVIATVNKVSNAVKIGIALQSSIQLLTKAALDNFAFSFLGFTSAISDNAFGTNLVESNAPSPGSDAADYWRAGVTAGNSASLALAVAEGGLGESLMTGGGIATATGVGAEVGIPTAAAGGVVTLHSLYFFVYR